MAEYSGMPRSSTALTGAMERLAARRIAQAAQTLDTETVARRLAVCRTRVQRLLDDGDLQGTVNVIRVALADPIPTPRGKARVAVSVGRSRCPGDGNQARALIALAESNATAIS